MFPPHLHMQNPALRFPYKYGTVPKGGLTCAYKQLLGDYRGECYILPCPALLYSSLGYCHIWSAQLPSWVLLLPWHLTLSKCWSPLGAKPHLLWNLYWVKAEPVGVWTMSLLQL